MLIQSVRYLDNVGVCMPVFTDTHIHKHFYACTHMLAHMFTHTCHMNREIQVH